ncbi:MAG: hypothetical protein GXO39_04250 [Thermotogae bacterium]|nr:hypothetical protein [Thermotogota bacterium]
MPSLSRLNDAESHACHITSGSDNVFANGRPVARVGDGVCCAVPGKPHPSPGRIVQGSPNVFANGRAVARLGDATMHVKCGGGTVVGGSPNIFVN